MENYFFEIVVIGGGHAGVEAALASSRIGCKTLLLTQNIRTIGELSCNPSIGGIGKSQLVKEVDALGGIMGKSADYSGIQFKVLNLTKGFAVQSTRAQVDRVMYRRFVLSFVKKQKNLSLLEDEAVDIVTKNESIRGIKTKINGTFFCKSVILTAGTFLNGKIYIGLKSLSGGRMNDKSSIGLSDRLKKSFPFRVSRLKTGTPPRIFTNSIDFSNLKVEYGDTPTPFFSYLGCRDNRLEQVPCFITYTNLKTHEIVRKNLNFSPMFSGLINGTGPRYCPSLEDKVTKFSEKERHQIFLEPETLKNEITYPNGLSTSLPFDIQKKVLCSIKGLEKAKISKPGYAVEYDFFDPRDLKLTLESKFINGFFLAGQINGTTGYEEASAQGLLSGVNAALYCLGEKNWFPRRDQAYIGVLVDDLCNKGTREPYRMFTSRAEYRLILREDNADFRLTDIGRDLGLVSNDRWFFYQNKKKNVQEEKDRVKNKFVKMNSSEAKSINFFLKKKISKSISIAELLKRPEINYQKLKLVKELHPFPFSEDIYKQVEIQIKYEGYIFRQKREVLRRIHYDGILLPTDMNYRKIKGLSNEVVDKMNKYKPYSVGQASRISGITPAAISVILIFLKNKSMYK